ncbi:MAG: transposase domain-containing protein [Pirellulales bacterium]
MRFTVVASALRHHLDVWAYLRDVLQRLAHFRAQRAGCPRPPEQLTWLLPDVWARAHPESICDCRQHAQRTRAAARRARRQKRRALAEVKSADD